MINDRYDPAMDKRRNRTLLGLVYSVMEDGEYRSIEEILGEAEKLAKTPPITFGGVSGVKHALELLATPKHGGYKIYFDHDKLPTRYRLKIPDTKRAYVNHGNYIGLYRIVKGAYRFVRMEWGDGGEKRARAWVEEAD